MSVEQNGQGQAHYRCRHRGQGCDLPSRSNRGLAKAAGLGLALLCDHSIRDAIRRHLEGLARSGRQPARTGPRSGTDRIAELRTQRSKLLALHYDGQISADQFGEEQARITTELEALEADAIREATAQAEADDLLLRFDQLLALLDRIDVATLWDHATDAERRTLLDELLGSVTVHDDRLVVAIHGAPPLNVAFPEVGLKAASHSENGGVGGGT